MTTIATHRNNSDIKVDASSLQTVATLAKINNVQREWLDRNNYNVCTDDRGNVSLSKRGKAIGDPNANWIITEERQMWEVPAPVHFMSSFTGRFHVSLVSNINGKEYVYDRASHVTLRAALQMTR